MSHSLGSNQELELRGQINVRSLKTGSLTVQQDSTIDLKELKVAADANEFYHLEATVKTNNIERIYLTSTKACLLYESQLSDIITIHVDLLGNIYGVSISTSRSQCNGEIIENQPNLNTTVLISYMEHGPVPDVAMYVQKMEQEKVAKERGETKDNRSFFAKYWMYILPVVIITIHVDLLGNIYGVSISTSRSQCNGEIIENQPNLNTTVLISYMEHGPVPDVAMYVQKMEQEKVAKERGETKDNRSFFAKYWMYILPVVLVFMMSGASNPEQGSR
nr:EOG090X0JXR [Polyphemus pediculus]